MLLPTFFLALISAVTVSAFTNGSLVPSYICNPTSDGLPKNYAQLLAGTRKRIRKLAFNPTATQDNNNVTQLVATNGTKIANSAYILASFHNTLNSVEAIPQGILVTTASGGPLKAGASNSLVLSSGTAGVPLDGVLIYGQDATGTRQGSFADNGGMNIFVNFAGCGLNPQGKISGVIQQDIISENETYAGLAYNAPACVPNNNLTLAGLSVTDNGFGVWSYSFAVTGSNCTNTTTTISTGTKTNTTAGAAKTTGSTTPAGPAAPAMVSVSAGTRRFRIIRG